MMTGISTILRGKKEPPGPENTENSADWLKNRATEERGRTIHQSRQIRNKPVELDLSMVSDDDDLQCYNTSEGTPVHTNKDVELQLLPKETNPSPETGIKTKDPLDEPRLAIRKSKILCQTAKQTEKLGGIPFYTNNNF